ncbi:MAG: DUF1799 domain-containing protein [Rhizobiaceae bacterium]
MLNQSTHESFTGVWPVNVAAVTAFTVVCSQWRTSGAFYLGLDYPGVNIALKAVGIKLSKDLFSRLQVIEFTVTKLLNGGQQ